MAFLKLLIPVKATSSGTEGPESRSSSSKGRRGRRTEADGRDAAAVRELVGRDVDVVSRHGQVARVLWSKRERGRERGGCSLTVRAESGVGGPRPVPVAER